MQSFGHKTVISPQSKLQIQSKNFFYKSCYILLTNVIMRHNYAVIWSQNSQFITIETTHPIKNLFLTNFFTFDIRIFC